MCQCVLNGNKVKKFLNLIVFADGRQEDDQHDVLEAVDPLPAFVTLTSNVDLPVGKKIFFSFSVLW